MIIRLNQIRDGVELNKAVPQIAMRLRIQRHIHNRELPLHKLVQNLAHLLLAEPIRDVPDHHRRPRLFSAVQLRDIHIVSVSLLLFLRRPTRFALRRLLPRALPRAPLRPHERHRARGQLASVLRSARGARGLGRVGEGRDSPRPIARERLGRVAQHGRRRGRVRRGQHQAVRVAPVASQIGPRRQRRRRALGERGGGRRQRGDVAGGREPRRLEEEVVGRDHVGVARASARGKEGIVEEGRGEVGVGRVAEEGRAGLQRVAAVVDAAALAGRSHRRSARSEGIVVVRVGQRVQTAVGGRVERGEVGETVGGVVLAVKTVGLGGKAILVGEKLHAVGARGIISSRRRKTRRNEQRIGRVPEDNNGMEGKSYNELVGTAEGRYIMSTSSFCIKDGKPGRAEEPSPKPSLKRRGVDISPE